VPREPRRTASAPRAPQEGTIKVATIGDFEASGTDNSEWAAAVRARFDAANARGGLVDDHHRHRKVDVFVCNTASDPQQTARCAHQAVDRHVVAVIGMSAVYSDRALPVLEAAHIPAIGVRLNNTADASSPASFPLAPGLTAELRAMPQLLAREGATRIAVIVSELGPATDDVLGLLERGRSLTGAAAGPTVRVAPGTTNFSAAIATATRSGVDGIVGVVTDGDAGALPRQLRASGFTGKYVTHAPWGNASAASDPDYGIDGTLVVGQFPPATSQVAGWVQLRHELHAGGATSPAMNEGTVDFWLAARVFGHLVELADLADLDTSTLDLLMSDIGGDTGGLTFPLSPKEKISQLPRAFNRTVTFNKVANGQLHLLTRRFFDPFIGQYR
jgi:ABC-type branched-subunit amino acid transport system substrate-binding protein